MNVNDIMQQDVKTVRQTDSLFEAARIMCDADVGSVPVIDDANRVVGMLTDRDVALAAYARDRHLSEIRVGETCSNRVQTVSPTATTVEAEQLMRRGGVQRLPVVDRSQRLQGILSLHDLAQAAMMPGGGVTYQEVGETLAAVCTSRKQRSQPTA